MTDELTLATKIETGETLFDFIRRCGRIKPEHWKGYSGSRELYEKLVTPALVAHLLDGAAHLLIQADHARDEGRRGVVGGPVAWRWRSPEYGLSARVWKYQEDAPALPVGYEVEPLYAAAPSPPVAAAPAPVERVLPDRAVAARLIGEIDVNMGFDIAGIIREGAPSADVNEILMDAADAIFSLFTAPSPPVADSATKEV